MSNVFFMVIVVLVLYSAKVGKVFEMGKILGWGNGVFAYKYEFLFAEIPEFPECPGYAEFLC